jgi:sec-independent protein translocase protein TatA
MFGLGHWEIILILVIILILFGAGKLPKVAGDIAKGIKSFKEGMKEEDSQGKKISEKEDKK